MKKILSILICSMMVLPMASQQKKKATTQVRKTTVSQPTKTAFEFKIQWDASFKKEGENNFYVVNFGKKSAHQLYMDVLSHIASIYKNPNYVTSKVEDRSIVINGYAGDIAYFKDHWGYYYSAGIKYRLEFQFKEGKIRVNAPTALDLYAEGSSETKKFSDYDPTTNVFFNLFSTEANTVKNEIDKYVNTLISTVIYGSRDEDW